MDLIFLEILLRLYVITHGIAFGAGFYEIRIILPEWLKTTMEKNLWICY